LEEQALRGRTPSLAGRREDSMSVGELVNLWKRTIGQTPTTQQFETWAALREPEVIKRAIIATAKKNLKLNGEMSEEYRIRYASSVMIVQERRAAEHAANRQAISAEFRGTVVKEELCPM
jgi:hypothetical protein